MGRGRNYNLLVSWTGGVRERNGKLQEEGRVDLMFYRSDPASLKHPIYVKILTPSKSWRP